MIDDDSISRAALKTILSPQYTVYAKHNAEHALAFLDQCRFIDLILLDLFMPGMDGFELCTQLKQNAATRDIPVLMITGSQSIEYEARGFALGIVDFIYKPFSAPLVLARVKNYLQLVESQRTLSQHNIRLEIDLSNPTYEIVQRTGEMLASQASTMTAFCALAEARDNETGNHIRRTQHYVKILAEYLRHHPRFRHQLTPHTIELLFRSAPLHDIGKVAIPDAILHKPGELTPEEWKVMRRHAEYGRDAILRAETELGGNYDNYLRFAHEIAFSHHEKWDGSGYPLGLIGDEIPLSARLMAAADVYDALISRRVYKPAFSHEKALSIISEGRSRHFDPDITDALLALADDFLSISQRFRDHS